MSNNDNQSLDKAAALQYNADTDKAPTVIAKGRGEIARKIIAKAQEEDIHIETNQDLAEVLVQLDIGEEIPPELYKVVAEIISFLYELEEK